MSRGAAKRASRAAAQEVKETPGRVVKLKFVEKKEATNPKFVPMNAKQRKYAKLIQEHNTVFATGYAGTSKTFVPTCLAAEAFIRGDIEKIILSRPNISNSESLGMFKGTLEEKMKPWLRPVLNILRMYMSHAEIMLHIEKENIEFVPMETIKGNSFENAFIICDEAEDLSFDEMKKMVTRQGKNSKLILAGDITQSELKAESGLRKIIEISKKYDFIKAAHIDFNSFDDIVRSEEAKSWVMAFAKEGV